MRRLIWGFAGLTYHIVGNLMSRLNIIFFRGIGRKVGRSLSLLILGMPVCPWFGLARRRRSASKLFANFESRWERERERERERETSACIRISFNLEKYHVSVGCWKWYLEILLVRIGFCTTKSDMRQYWRFACFLSHAQMLKLTKHSFLNSIRIWSGSELWQRFFNLFLRERGSKYHKKRAIIGPPAACWWWPNVEWWLGSFWEFQGIRSSIAKKFYDFVIFQVGGGGGPDPLTPSGSAHGTGLCLHLLR